jgi:hypothetical protein
MTPMHAARREGMRAPSRRAVTAFLLCGAAFLPGRLAAQDAQPTLQIIEPAEWAEGRSITLAAGRSLTIRGLAGHPAGLLRVLVNGEEAALAPVPEMANLYNFEKVFTPADTARRITITVVPRQSAQRSWPFEIAATGRTAAPQQQPPAATPRTVPAGQLPLRDPWGSFRMRGIGYGVAAVGGAVLLTLRKSETSKVCGQTGAGFDCVLRTEESPAYFPIGAALIGAAVIGGATDALLTSRRARSAPAPAGGSRNMEQGASLEAPSVHVSHRRVGIDWIRLRF